MKSVVESEELIDIYNGKGEFLNDSKKRKEVHKTGLWHKAFHCWIINKINGENFILFQKRSSSKNSYPNKFDVSVGGHYASGERIEGGLRELKEELGIEINEEKLIPLGTRICVDEFEPNRLNYEFQDVFFLFDTRPLIDYELEKTEVSGIVPISLSDGMNLFLDKIKTLKAQGYLLNKHNQLVGTNFIIEKTDFIPTLDNYYLKIFFLAELAIKGERQLFI